jgi:hypothetical protein
MCFILLQLQGFYFISSRAGKCDGWHAVGQSSLVVIKSVQFTASSAMLMARQKLFFPRMSVPLVNTGLRQAGPLSFLHNLTHTHTSAHQGCTDFLKVRSHKGEDVAYCGPTDVCVATVENSVTREIWLPGFANPNTQIYSKTCLKRNAIVPVFFFRFHRFPCCKGLCFNKTKYKKYDRLGLQ